MKLHKIVLILYYLFGPGYGNQDIIIFFMSNFWISIFSSETHIGCFENHFRAKNWGCKKKFYDHRWAIKVYDLGYSIKDTTEKNFRWRLMATTIYLLYYVIQKTSSEITFNYLYGLMYGIKEAIQHYMSYEWSPRSVYVVHPGTDLSSF